MLPSLLDGVTSLEVMGDEFTSCLCIATLIIAAVIIITNLLALWLRDVPSFED